MSGVHRLTAWLEQCLGDPRDHRRALSVARSAACDRAEEFPDEAARELDGLGLPRWFAPAGSGGALRGMDELLGIVRALARRDLTVVVGCATTYRRRPVSGWRAVRSRSRSCPDGSAPAPWWGSRSPKASPAAICPSGS